MGVNTNIMTTNKKTENFLVDNINLNQNMHTNNLGNQSQIISQNTNNIIENDKMKKCFQFGKFGKSPKSFYLID